VYFDLDGTLVGYAVPFPDLVERALRECGVDPTTDRLSGFLSALDGAFEAAADDPYVAAAADVGVEGPESLASTLVDREVEATEPTTGARETLGRLADRDRDLGVLTNGVGRVQRRKLAACGLDEFVDAVVVSGEVGARKPDPRIFRIARARLGGGGPDPVFVADDLERDLRPAVETGFDGLLYDPEGTVPDLPPGIERVAALRAVPDRL
jgi:HAD superfamily hydrolase (TIGR01549 family)